MARSDPVARQEYNLAYQAADRLPEGVAKKPPEQHPHCEVDGIEVRKHAHCWGCHILQGDGHLERVIQLLCGSCQAAGNEWKRWTGNMPPPQSHERYA